MGDRVTKQRSRLRFKRPSPVVREAAVGSGGKEGETAHCKHQRTQQAQPQEEQETPELAEWGPQINGYRFVGAKDSPKHYRQRDWLVTDTPGVSTSNDFYNWSYTELPEYQAAETDVTMESKNTDEDHPLAYDKYHSEWELIRQEGHRGVIFPLKHTTDELNLEKVDEFMNTASDYVKALKVERIRWHPDKMLQTLKISHDSKDLSDELLQKKITTTFQIINQLWQSSNTTN